MEVRSTRSKVCVQGRIGARFVPARFKTASAVGSARAPSDLSPFQIAAVSHLAAAGAADSTA